MARNEDSTQDENTSQQISFEQVENGHGIEVIDPVDHHQYLLQSSTPVSLRTTDTTEFTFPVDAAVQVRTAALILPTVVPAYIRDQDGTSLAEVGHLDQTELSPGNYSIELSAPIQLYLRASSALTVTAERNQMRVTFEEMTDVMIGARSYRDQPVATVTTTDDPVDMMAAISTFGSALRTTTPERSYPSYRGHPPIVERGDTLDIPEALSRPDAGVSIELPPEYRSTYVAAPLAYYLGADLRVGETPQLVTETGFEFSLDGPGGFEQTIERVLKQTFLLDCVTRTEGRYSSDLHERRIVERHLDHDFAALYDLPSPDRIEAYLTVPFETIEEAIPEWKLTAYAGPIPDTVEMLPFVVGNLAVVQMQQTRDVTPSHEQVAAIDEFLAVDITMRGSGSTTTEGESSLRPIATESLEQVWIGDGTPTNASKATTAAYHNRLSRAPIEENIEVTIVCNDDSSLMPATDQAEMVSERDVIGESYGSHRDLPFEVTVHHNLTVNELQAVLGSSADLFHYIGHVDENGFECIDGSLDAATLDTTSTDAFLVNACQSYEQGMNLIEAGSIGGIVTLSDVPNTEAVSIGTTLARLLNGGFPLRAALEIARDESLFGQQYTVVGDGGMAIAQPESGTPILCEIERAGDLFELELRAYPTTQLGMGSMFLPYTKENERYFLNSGRLDSFELSKNDLEQFLSLEDLPVWINDELYWSNSIDLDDLF